MGNTKTFRQILNVIKYRDCFCFWRKKQLILQLFSGTQTSIVRTAHR